MIFNSMRSARRSFRRLLLCGPAILICGSTARAADVTVFAASSLTDALKETAAAYENNSGDKIIFNFAASSLLARQIEEGAPADIFFSADETRMDELDGKGLIQKDSRKSRLSNSLVIVIPNESKLPITSPADLAAPAVKHIALADPKTVPAGVYSKAVLEKEKLWPKVESKIVSTANVRAALATVESGDVDAGLVFKTDALISKKVKVACEIPHDRTPEISYPVALVKDAKQIEPARKFLQYLNSDAAAKVFEKYGFIVLR